MDLLTSAMDAGAALAETFNKPANTGASQTRYGTVVKNNGTTLDVELCGATSAAVPMLTTCANAVAGDRCLLTVDGPLVTVTGILANADNAHYVKYFYGSDSTSDVPGYCKMEKTGQIVTVSFAWSKNSNGQSGTTLATLPENARPVIRTVGVCVSMGTNNFGQVTISPNGKITITSAVNSSYFAGSVTFYAA